MRPGTATNSASGAADRAARVRSVVDRRAVTAAFQPIVCLQTGEVAAFEALCRPSQDSGYSSPSELFHDAEQSGLIWDLEMVTRTTAIEAAASFPDGVLLFINNEPATIVDARFAALFESAVREHGLVPSRFVLEITEAADEQLVGGLMESIQRLRGKGFQIAIDDAGAGTSGLNRLMLVRPTWLKLDRELIDRIDTDRYKYNLVRFLVHFARLSGVNIIAEGIEREEELSALIGLGVSYGQGYFLGKPMPRYQLLSDELRAWVVSRWQAAQSGRLNDSRAVPAGTICRPAEQAQASSPVHEMAARLLKSLECGGVVVMDGRRVVGWCSREAILLAAEGEQAAEPIGSITPATSGTLPPEASLSEILELVSVRDDGELTQPVVIANREKLFGVVTLRALLGAAAGVGGASDVRVDGLTGFPGQVAADQRIKTLVSEAGQSSGAGQHTDAAIMDIQNFHDFNGAFGYEAGDQLIIKIAQLIRETFRPNETGVFAACLGGDRFLLTAPAGVLGENLPKLTAAFDKLSSQSAPDAGQKLAIPQCPTALRVLLIEEAFARIAEPRQLFVIERQLRLRARSEMRRVGPGRSLVIRDDRRLDQRVRRLSA